MEMTFEGPVAIIRLNDPDTLNAITAEVTRELRELFRKAARQSRAIVLAGSARTFSAGGNLASPDRTQLHTLDCGAPLEDDFNPMMMALRDLAIPWVSAVRGVAAGGGSSLALAADLIVAGESAYFLQPFLRAGLVPDCGSTFLLVRTIGRPRAMELMLLGERLSASQALAWGLINRVVPDDEVESCAIELASRLARGPEIATSLTRRMAWAATEFSFADSLHHEAVVQTAACADPDFAEGVLSFLDKRPPVFGKHRA